MADQSELDLPIPETHRVARPKPRRGAFGGFSLLQIGAGLILLAAIVWGMWVTKLLLAPKAEHIVSARLSSIVGDYVQAQARSASPPAQVEQEMRKFMATLDGELERRSAGGQIVLVGEAVLTKNVPDITDSLKSAVYAAGIPHPREAPAAELQALQQQAMAQAVPQVQAQAGAMAPVGDPGIPQGMAVPAPQVQGPQGPAAASAPAATVSTFGALDGNGGR